MGTYSFEYQLFPVFAIRAIEPFREFLGWQEY